jgi:hypothetical protein
MPNITKQDKKIHINLMLRESTIQRLNEITGKYILDSKQGIIERCIIKYLDTINVEAKHNIRFIDLKGRKSQYFAVDYKIKNRHWLHFINEDYKNKAVDMAFLKYLIIDGEEVLNRNDRK